MIGPWYFSNFFINLTGVPTTPAAFDGFTLTQNHNVTNTTPVAPPAQDKYAALKDLDNAFKTQNVVDWNSSGSNGSLYSSPTPTGSVYSSPSPQSSMFGSPSSQGRGEVFDSWVENCIIDIWQFFDAIFSMAIDSD